MLRTIARWNDAWEFAEIVAYLHELVHYLQDATTGVGAWDYYHRKKHLPTVLRFARTIPDFLPNRTRPYGNDLIDEWNKDYLFVRHEQLSNERRHELIQRVKSITTTKYQAGCESSAYIEHLLEGEAAATVFLQIIDLKVNNIQSKIMDDNKSLYSLDTMNRTYTVTLQQVMASMIHLTGSDTVENMSHEQRHWFVRMVYSMAVFLIDLSCAHPSPRLLERLAHTKFDYEPGIKFLRLVQALQKSASNGDDFSILLDASHAKDARGMEKILLRNCDFPYCESEAVYDDWQSIFREMTNKDDERIFHVRQHCCKVRLDKPWACVTKHLLSFTDNQIPILALTSNGYDAIITHPDLLEPRDRIRWVSDILTDKRDMQLKEFFFTSGRFVCPFAEAGVCQIQTKDCTAGIKNYREFPAWDPDIDGTYTCIVRGALQQSGFEVN